MTGPLCFIDVETTGLDPRVHQPYEVSAEFDYTPLTDEQREDVAQWCHRWTCSFLADDYCGCSLDHLDREMADRLIEDVIEPLLRENTEHIVGVLGSLHHFANALEQMSSNLRAILPTEET